MTIMDQILEIEEKIEHLKVSNQKEINSIIEESKKKYQVMQDNFAQEFTKESKILESEMLNRVELYKENLDNSASNIKEQLEISLHKNKEELIQKICNAFWLE